jgi:hypothetical protein
MDEIAQKKAKPISKKSSHVRFTDDELSQLEKDERTRGVSIPVLLKEAYFEGRPTAILMTKEDQKQILLELQRQGNNLNQLTRQVNAGILASAQQELAKIGRALEGMTALLRGKVLRLRNAE